MDAVAARAATYQRHAPEQDLLYQILSEHLGTFLQECRTEAHGLPAYVEGDLRAYLECGVWLRAAVVPGLQRELRRGFFVQATRVLSQLHGAAYG